MASEDTMSPFIRTDWDEVVHRARNWRPYHLHELRELDRIIESVYAGEDEESVRILSETMLRKRDDSIVFWSEALTSCRARAPSGSLQSKVLYLH